MKRLRNLSIVYIVFIFLTEIANCQEITTGKDPKINLNGQSLQNKPWDLLNEWMHKKSVPFSFICGSIPSSDLLKKSIGEPGVYYALNGALQITYELTEYQLTGCVEWRVKIKNTGSTDSPVLSDLMALDLDIPLLHDGSSPGVYHSRGCGGGDEGGIQAFMYSKTILNKSVSLKLSNPGGVKTGKWLPFFNLDLGESGIIGAVGWAGRWMINIDRLKPDTIHLRAGMERLHTVLHPGEEIRTPSILLMAWKGNRIDGHNRFRQHILENHTPRNNGQLVPDLICFPTWGGMKTENHLKMIETIRNKKLPYNCYWIDAGWYGPPHECEEYQNILTEDWFFNVGDWQVNTIVHPKGLKPISDAAHAAGMKFLLWFDQERAVSTCKTVAEHPGWYFRAITDVTLVGRKAKVLVFNFGNPEARRWMTDFIASQIKDLGIDVFRNDGNFGADKYWDEEDTPDRIGISEIRYVEGINEFWDELRRRFPNLILDIVQRRDLETISKAVDLSRADYNFVPGADPTGNQVSLLGISHWIPLSGTGALTLPGDTYNQMSAFSSSLPMNFFAAIGDKPVIPIAPADYPYDWHKNIMELHKKATVFFRGDFYPLLESSTSPEVWAAMQFHRNDLDAGMLLFYRRPLSPYFNARFKLSGLSPESEYSVDFGQNSAQVVKGRELMNSGLLVTAELPRTAGIIFYKLIKK